MQPGFGCLSILHNSNCTLPNCLK
uniref:Uncharacterized protein n=1 Tax=Anguilla anguilla TaxID=7936 RepID=A0A0E9RS17_ANGAN